MRSNSLIALAVAAGFAITAQAGDKDKNASAAAGSSNSGAEKMFQALDKNKAYTIEYSIRTANGEIKRVWEKGIGILSDGGLVLEGVVTEYEYQKQVLSELK